MPVQEKFDFPEAPISPLPEKTMLLPPPPAPDLDPRQLSEMRERVEAKCQEFRVDGRVEDVLPGPIITTYEFRPAAGVKYAQVVRLEEDLALGLQVEAVRIERIPGKATVGIEVPNPERQTIVLREIIESSKFIHSASPLTLALGKDIHGRPFVADMQRMPHLLIGGFTGSGKSVGINAMIMSILFKATPEQVRFILIDPKQVELGIYEKLPHLLTPIISDPKEAAKALRWAVRQMRERYSLLAACKVRNLTQYNALLGDSEMRRIAAESAGTEELKPLPFIVVIIDELADLMMTCANEVEDSIGHLSQMARAVGIHLLFATQRPSVDIVTGVIKAGVSSRHGRHALPARGHLEADPFARVSCARGGDPHGTQAPAPPREAGVRPRRARRAGAGNGVQRRGGVGRSDVRAGRAPGCQLPQGVGVLHPAQAAARVRALSPAARHDGAGEARWSVAGLPRAGGSGGARFLRRSGRNTAGRQRGEPDR
jgi:DNA segregation ATPase FtsK/SpoIIIE-like protein